MRTLTAQQTAVLSAPIGYRCFARVKVLRGSTWHDLTALLGGPARDFLEEVQWSENTEAPCATASVRCLRDVNGVSLAPLMATSPVNLVAGSYDPLLREGRTFTIETSVAPVGQGPSTWTECFRGRIDEVDAGGDVTFTGRSLLWGTLQDTFIETERQYGSASGVAVQTVMQSILNDNALSSVVLYCPVSPSWALKTYVQKGEPVADALLALARQLGWELREKWLSTGPNTGGWRLTLYAPDRSASVPVWTYTANDYSRLEEVRTSLGDVRNAVEVVYSDSADRDAAGVKKRKTLARTDATSVVLYGRRFMRVAEAATSNIDTSTEAERLALAALADLKDVPLGLAVPVLHHPGLELGDYLAVTGNGSHFSGTQAASAQGLSHSFNAGGGTTKVTLVGKPSIGRRVWMDREQRPQIAAASPFTGPDTVSNLSVAETTQGLVLRFNPPVLGRAADEYELHVSTTSGFTPSDTTRRVVGALTEMALTNLTPGTTYYAKVVPRDSKGNRGTASAQVSFSPRYVEPRFLAKRISYGELPMNGSWEALNGASGAPDNWELTSGTWGVGVTSTTDAYTGGAALRFPYVGAGASNVTLLSDAFVVEPSMLYGIVAVTKSASGGSLGYGMATLRWYDGAFVDLGSGAGASLQVASGGAWTRVTGTAIAPTTARYGRVEVSVDDAPRIIDVYVDSVRIEQITGVEQLPSGTVSLLNSFSAASGFGAPNYYVASNSRMYLEGAVTRASTPAAGTVIFTIPNAADRPPSTRQYPVATNTGPGIAEVLTNGDVRYVSGGVGVFSLDGISYRRV